MKSLLRKAVFLLLLLLLSGHFIYAGELTTNEAIKYFSEGLNAQKSGDPLGAKIAYEKALLLNPEDIIYRKCIINNLGIIYAQMGNIERARQAFVGVLQIDPNYTTALLNLGLLYYKQGNRILAADCWLKAMQAKGNKMDSFIIEESPRPGD